MLNASVETSTNVASGPWSSATRSGDQPARDPLDEIASFATRIKARRGTAIFADGDDAEYCYRIVSGEAMAFKADVRRPPSGL